MIKYFPTPYEDEWWYSVLCRYYKTTGIKSHSVTKEILYGSKSAHMGTFFPNSTVAKVVMQLPKELFDIQDILLNHTPLKYYVRLYPKDEQEYIVKYLSEGGSYQMTHLWKNYKRQNWKPRYCPLCVKEDNEPYYHLSHQIPMVSACTKHSCKLNEIEVEHAERELNTTFYDLSLMTLDEKVETASDIEILVSRLAIEYLNLPLHIGPTSYNNLITGLMNAGNWKISRTTGLCIDDERVYRDMVALYDSEIVERAFGDKIAKGVMVRIKDFKTLLPDRYVLLQGLIGMSTSEMFGKQIEDKLKDKLQKMSARKGMQSVKGVARELDLKEWEIRMLCKYYDIEPFWMEREQGKRMVAKTGLIRFTVDERELKEIRDEADRLGFKNVGDYMLGCVRFVRKTNNEIHHQTKEAR